VDIYEQVPSIREYWILDPLDDASHPSLSVYRRRGCSRQKRRDIDPGATHATPILPGLALMVDPRG
jgi:hypothetical protein